MQKVCFTAHSMIVHKFIWFTPLACNTRRWKNSTPVVKSTLVKK